jgi:hypothetical protein
MNRTCRLERRIRLVTLFFIGALVLSGATAIPLTAEVDWLVKFTNASGLSGPNLPPSGLALWLMKVQEALHQTEAASAFLFYGTDWLAFGHFVIALAFIGALRDPLRNAWLFTFGIIACVLVIPYALVFGALRGIPLWWRLIDCSFGVFGVIPLWLCRRWVGELETGSRASSDSAGLPKVTSKLADAVQSF